jgi:hypothetical protein
MKRYRSRTEISALILEEGNQRDSVLRIKIMSAKSITRALPNRHSQYAILPNINLGSHTVKKVSGYVRNHNRPCFRDQMTDSQSMMGKSQRQSRT